MKKSLSLLAIVALAFIGGASQLYAVAQLQPKEFVIIEVTIGKEKILHKLKVPVVPNPKERKFIDGQLGGGGFGFTGYCPKDVGCEYSVIAIADAVNEDKSKVTMNLSFKDRKVCDVEKEFLVVRGKVTELKTKCGAKIKAYYDVQSSTN